MPHFYGLSVIMLAGTAIFGFAQAVDQPLKTGQPRSDRYFVGYYRADNLRENSSLPLRNVKYSYYTHIIHIGLAVSDDGEPSSGTSTIPSREFTTAVHGNGVLGLISLVGNKKNFEKVAADQEALERFVRDMSRIVVDSDYDGIDVDWEHPDSPEAGKGWMTFMAALREMLDGLAEQNQRRYWLTTALPAGWGGAHLDGKGIADTVDFVNVMCYDGFGPWGGRAGNHAPLFPDPADPRKVSMARGMAYWRDTVGVPAGKLVMGLPFYAYVCTGYEPYEPIIKDAPGRSVDGGSAWTGIAQRIERDGWERRFNEESQAAWYFAPDGSAFVAADDPEVIAIKTRWAREQGFRGVFMWSMRCDVMPDGSRPLLDAMHRAWTEAFDEEQVGR